MPRRLGLLLCVVVAVAGAIALVAFFAARDDAEVAGGSGPGEAQPDRCARHDGPAAAAGAVPPTSGTHRPRLVQRDGRAIGDDALLHALELGNVVLVYDAPEPPAALRALQDEVAGPFDAEVAAAGQSVILARRPGTDGILALAWRHVERAADAGDPRLRTFVEYWLGRGYADARGDDCPAPGD